MAAIHGYSLISVSVPPTILAVLFIPQLQPADELVDVDVTSPAAVVVGAAAAAVVVSAEAAVVVTAEAAEVVSSDAARVVSSEEAAVVTAGAAAEEGVGPGAAVDGEAAGAGDGTDAVEGVVLPLHTCIKPTEASSAFLQSENLDKQVFFKAEIVS